MYEFDLKQNQWRHVSGDRSNDSLTNFDSPYPGGVSNHGSVVTASGVLYIFGGEGLTNTTNPSKTLI